MEIHILQILDSAGPKSQTKLGIKRSLLLSYSVEMK